MIKSLVALPLVLLAGCSTNLTNEQVEHLSKPTLTMECESKCSVAYTDPRDRPRMPTNGWDATNTLINTVGNVAIATAPWLAVGVVATEGVRNAGSNTLGSNNNSSQSFADNSESSVDSSTSTVSEQPLIFQSGE